MDARAGSCTNTITTTLAAGTHNYTGDTCVGANIRISGNVVINVSGGSFFLPDAYEIDGKGSKGAMVMGNGTPGNAGDSGRNLTITATSRIDIEGNIYLTGGNGSAGTSGSGVSGGAGGAGGNGGNLSLRAPVVQVYNSSILESNGGSGGSGQGSSNAGATGAGGAGGDGGEGGTITIDPATETAILEGRHSVNGGAGGSAGSGSNGIMSSTGGGPGGAGGDGGDAGTFSLTADDVQFGAVYFAAIGGRGAGGDGMSVGGGDGGPAFNSGMCSNVGGAAGAAGIGGAGGSANVTETAGNLVVSDDALFEVNGGNGGIGGNGGAGGTPGAGAAGGAGANAGAVDFSATSGNVTVEANLVAIGVGGNGGRAGNPGLCACPSGVTGGDGGDGGTLIVTASGTVIIEEGVITWLCGGDGGDGGNGSPVGAGGAGGSNGTFPMDVDNDCSEFTPNDGDDGRGCS